MAQNSPVKTVLAMKFYEFAAISMLVLAFFPISLVVSWIAFGSQTTRELIEAMIKDWLQTMLIIVGLISVAWWIDMGCLRMAYMKTGLWLLAMAVIFGAFGAHGLQAWSHQAT